MIISLTVLQCKQTDTNSSRTTSQPQQNSYYFRKEKGNRLVIIFVNGVLGDPLKSWTNENGTYFPELLAKDTTFRGSDIFIYTYPSPLAKGGYEIDELVENFRLILNSEHVLSDHDQVLLVMHSMGGLVGRAYLIRYPATAAKVKGLYFYSTPTTGSEVARVATLLSGNPQFGKMIVATDGGSYLFNQIRSWLASSTLKNLPSYCAYELRETFGVRIVDARSATILCNERLDPIDADHFHMVKPSSASDIPFLALRSAYEEVMSPPGLGSMHPIGNTTGDTVKIATPDTATSPDQQKLLQLSAGVYQGALVLQSESQMFVGDEFRPSASPVAWRLRSGRYNQLSGKYWVCRPQINQCWTDASGQLRYWNADGLAKGLPEDLELFEFIVPDPRRAVVRIRQVYGDFVISGQGGFGLSSDQSRAAQFKVRFLDQ